MANILVVGCGKIGYPLGVLLINQGHRVTGIKKTPLSNPDPVIQWQFIDITKKRHFQSLDTNYDQIIVILTPASRSPEGYQIIYQQGLDNLLNHFDHTPRPGLIFVSATSVYAQNQGQWVNEESVTDPTNYNGKSLLLAEQQVLQFDPNALVVRFSGIYGPQRNRLLKQLEQPLDVQVSPPAYTNRIHQQDCIEVLLQQSALQRNSGLGYQILLASDSDPAPKHEVMQWLAEEAGLCAPTESTTLQHASQNKRCDNTLLLSTGYRLNYPTYKDGYGAMIHGR